MMHSIKMLMELEKLGKIAENVSSAGDHTAHRSTFNNLADQIRESAKNLNKLHNYSFAIDPTKNDASKIDAPFVEVLAQYENDSVRRHERDIFAVPTSFNEDIDHFFSRIPSHTDEIHVSIADPVNPKQHTRVFKIDNGGYVGNFDSIQEVTINLLQRLKDGRSVEDIMSEFAGDWKTSELADPQDAYSIMMDGIEEKTR